jgi:hypothetical protein
VCTGARGARDARGEARRRWATAARHCLASWPQSPRKYAAPYATQEARLPRRPSAEDLEERAKVAYHALEAELLAVRPLVLHAALQLKT